MRKGYSPRHREGVKRPKQSLKKIYELLEERFGDLKWWPAESDFEVVVGTILTQNTSWRNVEKAIVALKSEKLLAPRKIVNSNTNHLASVIRPSGYYRQKAKRLKEISRFILDECGGKIRHLKGNETKVLRRKLLNINGVGPETADSILLYAVGKPVFVVDAYTKRIFSRHGLVSEDVGYDKLRNLVENNFLKRIKELNQFHALLVEAGKKYCKKGTPLCEECPLCQL